MTGPEPADDGAASARADQDGLGRLGRLGSTLETLFGRPPQAPTEVRALDVRVGDGLVAGRAEADALADSGVDLVLLDATAGEPTPTAAVVAVAVLLDLEPVTALGLTPSPDWAGQVVAVRAALTSSRGHLGEPARLVDDPVLGRLTGLLAGCARRRTPVVLGGSTEVAAAALVAARLEPDAAHRWLAGARPTSAAGLAAHRALGLEPLLDVGVTAGGPALTLALLRAGIRAANPEVTVDPEVAGA